MTFLGTNLGASLYPVISIYAKNHNDPIEILCKSSKSQTELRCIFPNIKNHPGRANFFNTRLNYKIQFDNHLLENGETFRVYPDPKFYIFNDTQIASERDYTMDITGERMEKDLEYFIELVSPDKSYKCVVTSESSSDKLKCKIQTVDSAELNEISEKDLRVLVKIDSSQTPARELGLVKFESENLAISYLAVFLAIIVLSGMIMLFVYRKCQPPPDNTNGYRRPPEDYDEEWLLKLGKFFFGSEVLFTNFC